MCVFNLLLLPTVCVQRSGAALCCCSHTKSWSLRPIRRVFVVKTNTNRPRAVSEDCGNQCQ